MLWKFATEEPKSRYDKICVCFSSTVFMELLDVGIIEPLKFFRIFGNLNLPAPGRFFPT